MPIRHSYTVVDGKLIEIEQRCSVEEFMDCGDAAFDDKPYEVVREIKSQWFADAVVH